MSKIVYIGSNELYAQEITSDLTIPKFFVEDSKIRQALYATIHSFNLEEQKTILLRYWIGFSIEEIADLTKSPPIYITCVLILYLERLKLKLVAFSSGSEDIVQVEELFETELWKQYEAYLLECEEDPEYQIRFERTKEAFSETFFNKAAGGFV